MKSIVDEVTNEVSNESSSSDSSFGDSFELPLDDQTRSVDVNKAQSDGVKKENRS